MGASQRIIIIPRRRAVAICAPIDSIRARFPSVVITVLHLQATRAAEGMRGRLVGVVNVDDGTRLRVRSWGVVDVDGRRRRRVHILGVVDVDALRIHGLCTLFVLVDALRVRGLCGVCFLGLWGFNALFWRQ